MIRAAKATAILVLLHLLAGAGAAAPMLTPTTAHGILNEVRHAGAPVVLVHLWATWCPPCREEFPLVVELSHKYRDDGLKVLLVSADSANNLVEVQEFLARHGVDEPTLIKAQNDQAFLAELGGTWQGQLPASLFFDGDGTLKRWWPGPGDRARFEEAIQSLLPGAKPDAGAR
jgi:thiol-disulfide isomerase/thioredoxin